MKMKASMSITANTLLIYMLVLTTLKVLADSDISLHYKRLVSSVW